MGNTTESYLNMHSDILEDMQCSVSYEVENSADELESWLSG